MTLALTDDKYYKEIADAIRTAGGGSETYKPSEMAAAIAGLGGGKEIAKLSIYARQCYYRYTSTPTVSSFYNDEDAISSKSIAGYTWGPVNDNDGVTFWSGHVWYRPVVHFTDGTYEFGPVYTDNQWSSYYSENMMLLPRRTALRLDV